jgi:hypothetical protein
MARADTAATTYTATASVTATDVVRDAAEPLAGVRRDWTDMVAGRAMVVETGTTPVKQQAIDDQRDSEA